MASGYMVARHGPWRPATGKGLAPLKWHHIDACCGSAGKSTEQTSPFWKKSEKKRDFWRTFNDRNCSFWHTARADNLCTAVLHGWISGKKRRGRPRRRWTDDIRDWMGSSFAECTRMAQERELWRTMVSLSQVIDLQQWRWSSPVQSSPVQRP